MVPQPPKLQALLFPRQLAVTLPIGQELYTQYAPTPKDSNVTFSFLVLLSLSCGT